MTRLMMTLAVVLPTGALAHTESALHMHPHGDSAFWGVALGVLALVLAGVAAYRGRP